MNRDKYIWVITGFLLVLISGLITAYFVRPAKPVAQKHAMVVSENKLASQAGVEILQAGGNAVDAAVAVGYALAVVEPCCGNIGGGGFMTIHLSNGKNIFINFREKAPLRASKNMYLDKNNHIIPGITTKGYLAVGVPGTVMGLDTALQRYGKLSRQQVMAPAIRLAREGYKLTSTDIKLFKLHLKDFREQSNIADIFLKNNKLYKTGDILVQKNLADTLTLISRHGSDVFYKGPIANEIIKASNKNQGTLSLKDFADYNIEELKPIYCHYHRYTIVSAPPPSSGGVTLCEMLNILQNMPDKNNIRNILESMRYGFIDRNNKLGDPDFIKNPIDQLTSLAYADKISQKINQSYFVPGKIKISKLKELTDTTHYSVVDAHGNAVAVTYTLNGFFGAKIIAGNTGFFLNDEMDDFSAKSGVPNNFGLVQSVNNDIQPGKRPLSSMTPTIVLKNGKVYLVLGSPGGSRIITSVLLTILNVLDNNMNIQQAVNTPRYHFQNDPDVVFVEPLAFSEVTKNILKYRGYRILIQPNWGAVEAIEVNPDSGILYGANDRRRPAGGAVGY